MNFGCHVTMKGGSYEPTIQTITATSGAMTPDGLSGVINITNALTGTVTFNLPTTTGQTPQDGDVIKVRVANRGGQTINFDAGYGFGDDATLAMINGTVTGKRFHFLLEYYGPAAKWNIVGLARGF